MTLPDGVSQTSNSQNQALVWSRPLEYGDSGQYPCSAMNTVGTSAATLNLLVRSKSLVEWEEQASGRGKWEISCRGSG